MVSYWLGHADINTTHVYVEIDMEMKRRMLEKRAVACGQPCSSMATAGHPGLAR